MDAAPAQTARLAASHEGAREPLAVMPLTGLLHDRALPAGAGSTDDDRPESAAAGH